ncbi:MAG: ABC transporter ATP-binding protein [Pseudomonadota bacterium]
MSNFRELLHYITPERRVVLITLALMLAGSLVTLAQPWLAGLLAASVLGDSDWDSKQLLALWLGVIAISSLLGFFTSYRIGSTGQQLTANLRTRLYQHIQILPTAYYQQRRPGETLTLLSSDAAIISSFVNDTLVRLLPALLTLLGAFTLMTWLDSTIALTALVFLPLYVLAMKLMARQLRPLSAAWMEANSNMVSVVQENLDLLPTIKAFTREKHEQARFVKSNRNLLGLSLKQLRAQSLLSPAIGFLAGIGLIAILWLGTTQIESGRLSPSQMVSLLLYAALLISPLRTLANVYGQVQQMRGSAERILRFLDECPEPGDEGRASLVVKKGAIEFQQIHFAYPERPPVFSNLNLNIKAGETVAITGENGVGKTTLAHLLLRFADPAQGRILIDGVNTKDCTIVSVREHIGLVSQHVQLLNDTVAANIAFSAPDASETAIQRAAYSAHALTFIEDLPKGFDTVIGDQGLKLSGGQRQRISLARALLKDPPILILDEATAMFDPAGEKAFLEECREIFKQKTVLLITHRPASLEVADSVLTLRAGGSLEPTRCSQPELT